MNDVNPQSKDTIMKSMAVIGFIAVIVFGVWLAVQIVQVIPGAFSSLASIADGVYSNQEEQILMVAASESIVNNGEPFTISWTDFTDEGGYTFSYDCAEGVALDIVGEAGANAPLDCETPLNFNNEVISLALSAESEKRRFTDVRYEVQYLPSDPAALPQEKSGQFTVVNPSIPQSIVASNTEEVAGETETESEPEETAPEGVVAGEDTSAVAAPAAPRAPQVTETEIFAIPTSDPSGFVDLEVQFLGVGSMDNSNVFTRTATIDNDTRGSFQFGIKNIGTKTSDDWKFTAMLTSGTEYNSKSQTPLKPNERSIITLGFDAVGETGIQFFGAEVDSSADINSSNDSFKWAVEVVN